MCAFVCAHTDVRVELGLGFRLGSQHLLCRMLQLFVTQVAESASLGFGV
jgi:hypothetical protein